ncbi:MAG: sigma factor-like helix-turn-helix DNA-binding protein [Nocardioidaceae bacterium]
MAHDFVRQVYVASYRRLVGQLYGVCGDLVAAEEVVQEAFARALQHERQFRRTDNPEAWLRRVAVDASRSRWHHRFFGEPSWLAHPTDVQPELSPDQLALVAAMRQLPEAQRQVIALHRLADLPGYEVAEAVDTPLPTVKTHLDRGLAALTDLWSEADEAPRRALTEVLDPAVGETASEAARTPDFAVVEQRGRDRARRARTATIGAVVAVVSAGVLGTALTAADDDGPQADDQLREFEGPDGKLAEAIENGKAHPIHRMPSSDGQALLTTWRYFDYDRALTYPLRATNFGVTLTVDGEQHWSDLSLGTIYGVEVVDDEGFLLLWNNRTELVDEDGVRPVQFSEQVARLDDPEIDGIMTLLATSGRYFAVGSADATAAPIAELAQASRGSCGEHVVRGSDGALWAVEKDGRRLVGYGTDGSTTSSSYAIRPPVATTIVERDGQVAVAWLRAGDDLRVTVYYVETDDVATYDYPDVGGCEFDAAVLPDGRLLVGGPDGAARSLDDTWGTATSLPLVPTAVERGLAEAGDYLCAGLSSRPDGYQLSVDNTLTCTTDGELWQRVELAD